MTEDYESKENMERLQELTHPPVREGSAVTNDLLATLAAARKLSPKQADEVTFRSYRYMRREYPTIEPYEWELVFGADTAKMELRFALEEYAEQVAATGSPFVCLRRVCDNEV